MANPTTPAWDILRTADTVCDEAGVQAALARLAREITSELAERLPLVLAVMRGGVVFAGQLLPRLRFPLDFDYLDVTRYRGATTGGTIEWKVSPGISAAGRSVLVLDDILDEGHTLAAIRQQLLADGARTIRIAVFADKQTGLAKPLTADFVGISVPNRYVFGFGMDVRGLWRNLPAVYALREQPL